MSRFLALACLLVILSACKTIALHPRGEDGRCLNEDFVESVSGGQHCMFIKVEKPSQEFSEPPELIVTFHGDGGSHRQWQRMFKYGRETFPKLKDKNYIIAHFDRVGWGRSSGTSNGKGWNSYQPDYIDATMEAIHRLKNHYKASKVKAFGHSGGGITMAIGIGRKPEYAPDELLLDAFPGNVYEWSSRHDWRIPTRSDSPHRYIDTVPKHIKLIAVMGALDSNTYPDITEKYIQNLKMRGVDAQYIEIKGKGHRSILRSQQFQDTAAKFLDVL